MPYYNRDPKRDHNFDNPPYKNSRLKGRYYYGAMVSILHQQGFGFRAHGLRVGGGWNLGFRALGSGSGV